MLAENTASFSITGSTTDLSSSVNTDIEILQTPVLEAFTNNTSLLKSKLLSISRTNHLYLPIIKNNVNTGIAPNSTNLNNIVSVASDQATIDAITTALSAGSFNDVPEIYEI